MAAEGGSTTVSTQMTQQGRRGLRQLMESVARAASRVAKIQESRGARPSKPTARRALVCGLLLGPLILVFLKAAVAADKITAAQLWLLHPTQSCVRSRKGIKLFFASGSQSEQIHLIKPSGSVRVRGDV